MAQDPADLGAGAGAVDAWTLEWTTVVAIVGAAAGLGLWINVVGAAVLWTRFEQADLPATHIVGIVPNTTLLAIGIQALVLPLLVAIVAVGVFYVARRPKRGPHAPPSAGSFAMLVWYLVMKLGLWPERSKYAVQLEPRTGMRGLGRVLVLLFALAMLAVFLTFGGEVNKPEDSQYIFAWALASTFLVFGAATYESFARFVIKQRLARRHLYVWLAVAGAAVTLLIGFFANHLSAAVPVALLSPAAAFLAYKLPPGKVRGTTAGGWFVVFYALLGVAVFFFSGGGLELHPEGKEVAILVSVLMTSLALLVLYAVGERRRSAPLVAGVMFAVVAAWGGTINYLDERVTTPSFDLTAMVRKPPKAGTAAREPVAGFLIGRTGDAILVATNSRLFADETWRVLVIPRDEVEEMSVGPSCVISTPNLSIAVDMASELEAFREGRRVTPNRVSCQD
jgi:hypothetical protein